MTGKDILQRFSHMSLGTKLRLLTTCILVPLAVLICVVLMALVRYSSQYDSIIQNLTVASEFSIDFQKNLDYKVYRFIISGKNFEEFNPFENIEQARGVVSRLKRTTYRKDSKEQLRLIEKFMDNLEGGVAEIRDSNEGYNWSMHRLESNIRINTSLVTQAIYQYIYDETRELAVIRQKTRDENQRAVTAICVASGLLFVLLYIFALRTATSITRPIQELCGNIRMVGEGDFTIRPVASHNDEIQTLSDSFNGMVQRISALMENVRQKQQTLRQTELMLLQAQINPHFLYNTLDTIMWLAEDHQDDQVVAMVTSLSNFFRTSLSNGQDIITVQEEELHVCSYLEIQQARYRDILTYEINIPGTLYPYSVPKLTLQPLVENALYHGIKKRRGQGKIQVLGSLEGELMTFQVRDNGAGIPPEELQRLRDSLQEGKKVNFGLANIHERIQLYFGKSYGLEIESAPGVGTQVTVRLPAKKIQPQS